MASETCENIPPLKLPMLVPKPAKIGVTEETKLGSAIPTSSLFELLGVGKQKCYEKSPQQPLSTHFHPCASSPMHKISMQAMHH